MSGASIVERINGARMRTGAHRPFPMDDPDRVYFVEEGYLDIFAVGLGADGVAGRRRFVARVPAGEMGFGSRQVHRRQRPDRAFGFLAVPSLNATIVEGERTGVASDRFDLAATGWIDEWVSRLSEFLVRDLALPRDALLLEADPDVPYPAGAVLTAQHLDIVWVQATAPLRLLGRADTVIRPDAPLLPVTQTTWLETEADAEVSTVYTPTALVTQRLWPGFDRFNERTLEFALIGEAEAAEASRTRRHDAWKARRASLSGAIDGLGAVLGPPDRTGLAGAEGRTALQAAAHLVAESCGASLKAELPPPRGDAAGDPHETVERLARRSGVGTRWIALTPGWWRRDGPSFVGFAHGDGGASRPLAVLSDRRGGWRAVDPRAGASFAVDARTASGIETEGIAFYAPLPGRVEDAAAALRFSLHGRGRDLRTVVSVGVLGGLTALLTPILTGAILVRIIPRGDVPIWLAALGALLLAAFGASVFQIVHGLALLRIEGRAEERLQSAMWSRLLSLPAPFFRGFTAGDLADRANGIGEIRRILTGAAVQAAIGGIFSVFSLMLLFFYSWLLALYVCGLLLVLTGATWFLARGQLRHYRRVFRLRGALNGFVFQMIGGLAKLRVANAEAHVLARWAESYAEQKRESLAALRWAAGQHVVAGVFQPLAMAAIFAVVHYGLLRAEGTSFDLASFLSFNAAFGQLAGAVIGLAGAAAAVMGVVPLLERARPILDARPETAHDGIDPGDLKGDIEFANVTFRYAEDSPNAVEDISFHVRQGDYVAFVGPSGCGKSTLYRLLLGFEQPVAGTVFLDGHDLASLDPTAVRTRMGVVLQDVQIVAGSIFENIAGMTPLSTGEAWAAARAAAFEDDIRAMPMEMRTMLPEGGVGLSSGQKQRLAIARAIARRPRIVLFDEATSALDNRAQAMVQASLKGLGITRMVIAHRLSSIRDVDRIYVLDAGRIVESGRYNQLMEREGVFATLARRQLVQA